MSALSLTMLVIFALAWLGGLVAWLDGVRSWLRHRAARKAGEGPAPSELRAWRRAWFRFFAMVLIAIAAGLIAQRWGRGWP